jgi:hypothetical protein
MCARRPNRERERWAASGGSEYSARASHKSAASSGFGDEFAGYIAVQKGEPLAWTRGCCTDRATRARLRSDLLVLVRQVARQAATIDREEYELLARERGGFMTIRLRLYP